MRLTLYQPDMKQNTGTLLRLAACLGVAVDVIGPTGFDMTDRALRRAGLDYLEAVDIRRHVSWSAFDDARRAAGHRLILLSSRGVESYLDAVYTRTDILLLGRESAGVPDAVRDAADTAVRIPIRAPLRSLNVAVAGAMVLGEAMRQIGLMQMIAEEPGST